MKDKERIILLQKKLSIAKSVLKQISQRNDGYSSLLAEEAEERIEEIENVKG